MHKSIQNIVSRKPTPKTVIPCYVASAGPKMYKVHDIGSRKGFRFYSEDEIVERGGEYSEPHICYKHEYTFAPDVPLRICEIFKNSKW